MNQEPLPPLQPGQPGYIDPLLQTNVGYSPHRGMDLDPMMSKHLDASDMLDKLKNTLLGMEYDDEEDEWKPATMVIGIDDKGREIIGKEGPLMDPRDVRLTISYLQVFLSPNTFLSILDDDTINDIMWDVSKKLAVLFYNLRRKLNPESRDMIWGMVEYPILLGLKRATRKITLDAVSKTQQSHEIIQASPNAQQPRKDEFKLFGL